MPECLVTLTSCYVTVAECSGMLLRAVDRFSSRGAPRASDGPSPASSTEFSSCWISDFPMLFAFCQNLADSTGRILLKGDNITLIQPQQG